MINLFDAFTEFLSNNTELSRVEKHNVSMCLKNLLDADPEKEIMRRALEHYANDYNWPYRGQTVEGRTMLGMESKEAVGLARDALECGSESLRSCLLSMYDENTHKHIKAESNLKIYSLKVCN